MADDHVRAELLQLADSILLSVKKENRSVDLASLLRLCLEAVDQRAREAKAKQEQEAQEQAAAIAAAKATRKIEEVAAREAEDETRKAAEKAEVRAAEEAKAATKARSAAEAAKAAAAKAEAKAAAAEAKPTVKTRQQQEEQQQQRTREQEVIRQQREEQERQQAELREARREAERKEGERKGKELSERGAKRRPTREVEAIYSDDVAMSDAPGDAPSLSLLGTPAPLRLDATRPSSSSEACSAASVSSASLLSGQRLERSAGRMAGLDWKAFQLQEDDGTDLLRAARSLRAKSGGGEADGGELKELDQEAAWRASMQALIEACKRGIADGGSMVRADLDGLLGRYDDGELDKRGLRAALRSMLGKEVVQEALDSLRGRSAMPPAA